MHRSLCCTVRSLWGGAVRAVRYGLVRALHAVRYRYQYGTGTCLVWKVLKGTLRYGTVQYETEDRVAIRIIFLFACWGGVVVCECACECRFWKIYFELLLLCLERCKSRLNYLEPEARVGVDGGICNGALQTRELARMRSFSAHALHLW
jgi:hypothetical protein